MKWSIPAFITSLTTPLSAPILHNLLLTPLAPTSRITNILLSDENNSSQTSKIIRRLPHSQPLIFNLRKSFPILLSPLPSLGSCTTTRMCRKRLIMTHVLVPPIQGMGLFDVWVDLHH